MSTHDLPEFFCNTDPGLQHFWHPVAFSEEVQPDMPSAVTLLGQRYVVIRSDDGLAAFPDACPHRRAPLSQGRIIDGHLQCAYHGWQFDRSGICQLVPAIDSSLPIPPRANLQTVGGITERYGLIWLAPQAPLVDILEVGEWDEPGWDCWYLDRRENSVGAALALENFLDSTHFNFLHAATFGENSESNGVDEHSRVDWQLQARYQHTAFVEGIGEHTSDLRVQTSGPFSMYMEIDFGDATEALTFFLQPVDDDRTRFFFGILRNDTNGDPDQIKAAGDFNDAVYDEDFALLGCYDDSRVPLDLTAEVSTKADVHVVSYRKMLADIARIGLPATPVSVEAR